MRVETALSKFAVQLDADGRSIHTRMQYARHIGLLARWLAAEGLPQHVEKITPEVLAKFLCSDAARIRPDGIPKKATSVNTLRSSLRTFFGFVHAAGYSRRDPARLIRRARCGPPPPRALSDAEVRRLLEVLDQATGPEAQRDRVLIRLLLDTGIRLGSALAARWEDLDLESGRLLLRKTKGDRPDVVMLPPCTKKAIRAIPRPTMTNRALFSTRSGGPLSLRHAQRRISSWLRKAGIPGASAHSLRHTFATQTYRRTRDLLLVKRALRHRSIASTLVYTAISEPHNLREGLAHPSDPIVHG